MSPVRDRFLTVFFTILTIAFVAVVAVRIRSLRRPAAVSSATSSVATAQDRTAGVDDARLQPVGAPDVSSSPSAAPAGAQQEASPARALREERYRELLATPLPRSGAGAPQAAGQRGPVGAPAAGVTGGVVIPPPSRPEAKPSLLSRIVNAITGGPAPAPAAPQQTTDTSRNKNEQTPRDPSSDTTAPQLLGIDFTPAVVQDGEQTTIAVTATDDLSGVRMIAGNVISPSNALLGFAVSREGETNRFSTRLTVPKNAADGLWHVNFMTLGDNAGNSKSYAWSRGDIPQTAVFRVTSSKSDTTPPSLKSMWLDRPSMKPGEKNTLFVQADDDKTGVSVVTGVFISPQKFARFGFGCRQNGSTWECPLMPPAGAECGDWQLEQLQMQDAANNSAFVRADNPVVAAVRLAIFTDQCDSRPPVIQSVSVDPLHVTRPGSVTVTVRVSDDISGVASVNGFFVYTGAVEPGVAPPQFPFFARAAADNTAWVATIPIRDFTARGTWRILTVQVIDKASNLKLYGQADPVVAQTAFEVQ